MRLKVEQGLIVVVFLAHEFQIELLVFLDELLGRRILHEIHGAHVHAEELRGHVRMGFGILGVGDEHDGVGLLAVHDVAREDHAALFLDDEGVRGPDGDAVADVVFKRAHDLRLVHVLDDDVAVLEAEDVEPRAEGIVRRGQRGGEEGLAAHGLGAAVHFGVVLVPALDLGDGAVGADDDGGAERGLVVGLRDDGGAVAQVAEHGGQGAHGGETPFPGGQGVEDVRAGVEQLHLDVEPGFLVPALFLGVPHQEGFVLVQPRGGDFDEISREGAAYGQVQHAKGRGHDA